MNVLSLVMIMNNSDGKSLAKCLKLLKSVLDPLMEIAQLIFLKIFPNFNKCVTKRSQEDALNTTIGRKLFFIILTLTLFNLILAVIMLFYRIGECVERAERTEDGVRKKGIKACDMVKILEECVESINGNCATDVGPSKEMFQHECDQEKRTP